MLYCTGTEGEGWNFINCGVEAHSGLLLTVPRRSFLAVSYLFIVFVPLVLVLSDVFLCVPPCHILSFGGLRWLRPLIVAFSEWSFLTWLIWVGAEWAIVISCHPPPVSRSPTTQTTTCRSTFFKRWTGNKVMNVFVQTDYYVLWLVVIILSNWTEYSLASFLDKTDNNRQQPPQSGRPRSRSHSCSAALKSLMFCLFVFLFFFFCFCFCFLFFVFFFFVFFLGVGVGAGGGFFFFFFFSNSYVVVFTCQTTFIFRTWLTGSVFCDSICAISWVHILRWV